MATLEQVRDARGIVAELAAVNPLLQPVFDRLDREYQVMRAAPKLTRLQAVAQRNREVRELV